MILPQHSIALFVTEVIFFLSSCLRWLKKRWLHLLLLLHYFVYVGVYHLSV